jgi:L,D-peptidoglycan transpeptidase YkuD (ErfK/YbiS/YcfS/YnhG family)
LLGAGALAVAVPIGAPPIAAGAIGRFPAIVRAAGRPRCPADLADELASTERADEVVTVESAPGADLARVVAWRRLGRCFVGAGGPWPAFIGSAGISSHHVEGDGTTPAGAYAIGPVMYGIDPDPGVAYPYHRLVCGDWWDEDSTSAQYNTFEHVPCGVRPTFGGASEPLWTEAPWYDFLAVIEYNTDPVVPGRGSGIFIHVSNGTPTTGCVALPEAELLELLRWLRPAARPLVVIGTAAEIEHY